MNKLKDDLKLAEEKQASFLSTIAEFQAKSSSILAQCVKWKELDVKYGSIRERLLQQARELALQSTEVEEARRRVELREIEAGVKLEAAQGFLDEVREKEGELGLLKEQILECDSKLGLKNRELQGKERNFGYIQHRLEVCRADLEVNERELGIVQKALGKLRREIREREEERDLVQKTVEEKLQAKRKELAEVRNLIANCNAEHELKEKQLRTVERELQGKQQLLGLEGKKLDRLSEEVGGKERDLCSWQKSFEEKLKELEGKEKLLSATESTLKELELRRNEMERVTSSLSSCSSELQAKERELAESRNLIIECNAEHKLKEEQLNAVAVKLQLKEMEMGSVQQRLEECAMELEAKQKLLGSTQSTLDGLREEVCRKQNDLGSLHKSLEEQSKEVELRQNEIGRVGDLLSGCSSELQEKEKELAAIRNMITECKAEHEVKKKQLVIVAEELQFKLTDLDTVQHKVKESAGQLEAKQKLFDSLERTLDDLREKVSGKEEELGSLQKSVEEQANELDCRQKEVERTTDLLSSCSSALQRKERELGEIRNMVIRWNAEHVLKENQPSMEEGEIQIKETDLEFGLEVGECGEQLQFKWKLLGYMETALEELSKQISFREKDLSSLLKSIELKEAALNTIETSIKSREKVLRVKDNLQKLLQSKIDERRKELESVKDQKMSIQALVEEFAVALESNGRSLDMAGQQMKECFSKLELKLTELYLIKKKMIECQNKLADRRKHVEEHAEAAKMQRNELQKEAELFRLREEQLGSKEKLVMERLTELEAKEKELSSLLEEQRNQKQAGTASNIVGVISCESNAPDSPIEEPSPPDLTDAEISTALRSSDPAKMIFDQLKQSISLIGAKKCGQTVVGNRVVMLERLMGVSPNVSPEVKEAAIELAVAWRGDLRLEAHCSMDIIAFFLFLAAFGVTSSFKAEDLLELAGIVAHDERAPELCRSLGLANQIPGFIQTLSKKQMNMEAIRFSVAFNEVHRFPPNLLLLKHLEKTRIFEHGKGLLESQYEALKKHLDSLKAMSKHVAGLGLDPSVLNQKAVDHLRVLETLLGQKRSCLLGTEVVIKSLRYSGATVSGNKSPGKLGNLTEEGQRIKRQKN